ncbi:MAG TPA: glycosyltransferase N-terminal domain-containing protein, partial [Acidobacteriota bacterium]|nr:glycosyltransferase N-terminal domain-containing protein [Acidobacteriota bacterium]
MKRFGGGFALMLRIYGFFYALLYTLALAAYLPVYGWRILARGRRGVNLSQRLGRLPECLRAPSDPRRVWVHAVSVGEVNAVEPLVRALLEQGCQLFMSTTTDTGQEQARRLLQKPISQGRAATFYFPVDWQWLCRRWIKRMDPQVIVIAETELWPGFLLAS